MNNPPVQCISSLPGTVQYSSLPVLPDYSYKKDTENLEKHIRTDDSSSEEESIILSLLLQDWILIEQLSFQRNESLEEGESSYYPKEVDDSLVSS
jgi:hypothetical protein